MTTIQTPATQWSQRLCAVPLAAIAAALFGHATLLQANEEEIDWESLGNPAPAETATPAPAGDAAPEPISTPAQPSGAIEEIVVTAQKREQRAQDIPIALSAFTDDRVRGLGIDSIANVAPRVPSVYFGSFGAARPQLYIRGIGTRSFDPGSESSVGVFADEVYLGRSTGSFGALKDIERIEVLRGPQGTLYGRNTIGGAINIVSKGPTAEFEGEGEFGLSNFGGNEAFAAASGPLNEAATVQYRVSGWHHYRDGYVTNVATGTTFQGVDNTGGRFRLAFLPSDDLRIDLSVETLHDGNEAAFGGFNQGTGPSAMGAPANPTVVFFAPGDRPGVANPDLRRGTADTDPTLDRDARAYVGRLNWDLGDVTLTSVSAFRTLDIQDGRDLEGSSRSVIDQMSMEESDQFTQEIRLASNADGNFSMNGFLDWIVGAFYYDDRSEREDQFFIGVDSVVRAAAGTPALDVASSDYKITSYAFFSEVTAHLTEQLDLTVGVRYTRDDKESTQTGTTTDAAPIIAADFQTFNKADYDSVDPRVVASYKLTPDQNVYLSYSTGFKSGGFQYVPFTAAQANVLFEPEEIEAWELGYKSRLFGGRTQLNTAVFFYDYQDLQVSRIIDAGGAPVSLITNAASSEVMGFDLEVLTRVNQYLDLSLSYGFLDATYEDYVFNVDQNLDFSDTDLVRAPNHTVNVGAETYFEVGRGELTMRADYAWLSNFYFEPGEGDNRFGSGIPLSEEGSYGLLDLRVVYGQDQWRVTGFMTNALDEEYRRTVNALGSTIVGFAGQPRIYGVKFGWEF
jgi:iron complex outermembrane recepter protein